MPKIKHNLTIKQKRQRRVRSNLHGTATRPRLTVFRSNQHIYLQAVDDDAGLTLVSSNDAGKAKKIKGTKTQRATQVALDLAQELHKKKIKELVFDRGYYRYHGRVKAVADALREAGMKL